MRLFAVAMTNIEYILPSTFPRIVNVQFAKIVVILRRMSNKIMVDSNKSLKNHSIRKSSSS